MASWTMLRRPGSPLIIAAPLLYPPVRKNDACEVGIVVEAISVSGLVFFCLCAPFELPAAPTCIAQLEVALKSVELAF